MLKFAEKKQGGTTSAGSLQVRPAELAEALASVSEKTDIPAPGTLSLDETLREMKLEAIAEEVRQEIRTQRQNPTTAAPILRQTSGNRTNSPLIGFAAVTIFFLVAFAFSLFIVPKPANRNTGQGTLIQLELRRDPFDRAKDAWLTIGSGLGIIRAPLPQNQIAHTIDYTFSKMHYLSPTSVSLADLKDGQVLTVESNVVEKLQQLENQARSLSSPARRNLLKEYFQETIPSRGCIQVVRYGNQWYRRGWATQKPLTVDGKDYIAFSNEPTDSMKIHTPGNTKKVDLGAANKLIQVRIVPNSGVPTSAKFQWMVENTDKNLEHLGGLMDPSAADSRTWEKWEPIVFPNTPDIPSLPGQTYIPMVP